MFNPQTHDQIISLIFLMQWICPVIFDEIDHYSNVLSLEISIGACKRCTLREAGFLVCGILANKHDMLRAVSSDLPVVKEAA